MEGSGAAGSSGSLTTALSHKGAFRRRSFRREVELPAEQESALQYISFLRQKRRSTDSQIYIHGAFPRRVSSMSTARTDESRDRFDSKDGEEDRREPTFSEQFSAATIKNLQQQRRDPVACLLAMFLPVLFAVGTIVLSLAFPSARHSEKQFIDYSSASQLQQYSAFLSANLCFDSSSYAGTTLPFYGLDNCSTKTFTWTCAGIADGLLRDGFCWNNNTAVFNGPAFVRTFAQQAVSGLALVHSISTCVQVHWLARALGLISHNAAAFSTAVASISSSGYLYFAPSSPETDAIVAYLNATEAMFPNIYGGTFASVAVAEAHVQDLRNEGKNWGIIVVDEVSATSFGVEIRLNHTALPGTQYIVDKLYSGGTGKLKNTLYLASGFASIEQALLNYYTSQILLIQPTPPVTVSPMGHSEYFDSSFLSGVGQLVPIVLVLGFMYSVSHMTKLAVMEKELRIREAMMIMGMEAGPLYLSRYVSYGCQFTVTSITTAGLLKATYLKKTDLGVIFFTFFLFSMSCISLAGLMSAFFSKARVAAVLAPLIFLALSMPLFAVGNDSIGSSGLTGLLIVSPTCFTEAVTLIFTHELSQGLGKRQLSDFRDSPDMLLALIMLGVDAIVYFLLMLYVDAVMPNEWGTPRHPLFLLIDPVVYVYRRFWGAEAKVSDDERKQATRGRRNQMNSAVFEARDKSEVATVRVKGLHKSFLQGKNSANQTKLVAVNDLYWKLYENEIAVLLGHNGAGKSTLINLMTGMLPIDDGDCIIYGRSVRNDLRGARREIGFCPQHNILWPELTCAEHLRFYASIKGLKGGKRDAAIDAMLSAIDLQDKRDVPSAMLSGGQKRKLSVAIAFVGGSRLVFLDEPTAGMDVCARRCTWDLIKKMSAGNTILLTTHFMDEADLLGQQIAIMSKGTMACCGSSVFLKSRLGVGYNITLSVEAQVNRHEIGRAICSFVPSATPISIGAGEISYRLPLCDVTEFPALMEALEEDGPYLGVKSFSLNATTLEEIFLQVANDHEHSRSVFGSMKTSVGASTVASHSSPRNQHQQHHPFSLYIGPKRSRVGREYHSPTKSNASRESTASRFGRRRLRIEMDAANIDNDDENVSATFGPRRTSIDGNESTTSPPKALLNSENVSATFGLRQASIDVASPPKGTSNSENVSATFGPRRTSIDGNESTTSPPKGLLSSENGSGTLRPRQASIDDKETNVSVVQRTSSKDEGSGRVLPRSSSQRTSIDDTEPKSDHHGSVWGVQVENDPRKRFVSQLRSVLIKRFHNVKRDQRTLCLQILSPVLCILFAMLLTLVTNSSSPPIALSSRLYGTTTELVWQNCDAGGLFNTTTSSTLLLLGDSNVQTLSPNGLSNAWNLSNYLVTTSLSHDVERYAAWSCSDAMLGQALGIPSASVLFFNASSIHEVGISIRNYAALYARSAASNSKIQINVLNYPMPVTARETAVQDTFTAIMIGVLVMIPFSFIPSTFVSWIVKEKETKARHLQTISGLGFGVYWIGNFVFDLASFLVSELLVLAVFAVFNRGEYIATASVFFATFVLILLYGLSGIGMSYCLSFCFTHHATAQNWVMLANFVCGFFMVMVTMILTFGEGGADKVRVGLTWACRVVPAFCLGEGIVHLSQRQLAATFGQYVSPWDTSVCGYDLIFMAVETPIFFLFTYLWDRPSNQKAEHQQQATTTEPFSHEPCAAPADEDDDVAAERSEIENFSVNDRRNDLVIVRNLRKTYDNGHTAVRNVCFGVHPGEVFAFLGTNGAGKTTTMSILCQEQRPTSGTGLICGKDILADSEDALKCIGYCPQFDAVLDLLTVEEHLYLYAGIRGIVQTETQRVVEALVALCELTAYKATLACDLSGGNRRKLSVAMALVGGPQVVFLDEPSAGMDPKARRGLWTAIQSVAENCAVVLTTHHLEEVEALAHRVTIMVDGTLRCIGNKTHLKNKYGSGFEMSLRVASPEKVQDVLDFFAQQMPSSKLCEYRSLKFTFALPGDTRLSHVFATIEGEKERLGVTDYSIAHTSIEQVFLEISEGAHEKAVLTG